MEVAGASEAASGASEAASGASEADPSGGGLRGRSRSRSPGLANGQLGAVFRRWTGGSRSSSPDPEPHRCRLSPERGAGGGGGVGAKAAANEQQAPTVGSGASSSSAQPNTKTPVAVGPAVITARLRSVVGDSSDALPVLVGLVCARLAVKGSFSRDGMRAELQPHLPASAKAENLEEFLTWLEGEQAVTVAAGESAAHERPSDPRLLGRAGQRAALKEGDVVTLRGLAKRPELNGRRAVVLRAADPTQPGRCVVQLQGSDSQMAIRPENLQRAGSTSPTLGPTIVTSSARTEGAVPKSSATPKAEVQPAGRAEDATAPSPAQPAAASGSVFGSALAKLKAKAEAEQRGELVTSGARKKKEKEKEDLADKRGGIGSANPAGAARRELIFGSGASTSNPSAAAEEKEKEPDPILAPVAFVAAEDRPEPPSRKVVVFDPRRKSGKGRPVGEDSDDDEETGAPGVIQPRVVGQSEKRPRTQAQPPSSPRLQSIPGLADEPRQGTKVTTSPAAPSRGLAKAPSSPMPPMPVLSSPATGTKRKNMTLVVSDAAREEEKAQRDIAEKKRAMEDGKRQMLAKLTKQLQTCLARVQSGDLDDQAKEKYQDMISSLKGQMAKIGSI